MKVDYNRLFIKIKENKLTQKEFREAAKINAGTMQKMLHNGNITTDIICRICDYFHCMPDEIMEWIPDSDYEEKQVAREAKKADIESQMAELKKQLSQL